MKDLERVANPYGDDKVINACGLFGTMNLRGERFSGRDSIVAMANQCDRGNGLGGGYAAYGIYPEYADMYAFHLMFETPRAREETEAFLRQHFLLAHQEEIPHQPTPGIVNPPALRRYFAQPRDVEAAVSADDYVVARVMEINTQIDGAFVFSSGKNMGVFKGVGDCHTIGQFFCLEDYAGYLWTAHSRFPTNTQGWWGGAHPFSILDWTVVHNGEISSYGINRRYLEMHGYYCTMHTDTEVLAYALDLLIRCHGLPMDLAAKVLAPPFWSEIVRMEEEERQLFTALRQVYGSLLMNGPFTIIVANAKEMIGLGDRVRLRPLVAATAGEVLYLSSEEASIRLVCPELDRCWTPKGGEPIIGRLGADGVLGAGAGLPAEKVYGEPVAREVAVGGMGR